MVYRPDRTILITKRSDYKNVFPGKWTIPGGGLEVDDYAHTKPTHKAGQWYGAFERAMRREVLEETGLQFGKPEFLIDIVFRQPNGTPVIVMSFFAPYVSGTVKLNNESVDYKWTRADEADQYDLIDGIAEEIRMVDDILKKRN